MKTHRMGFRMIRTTWCGAASWRALGVGSAVFWFHIVLLGSLLLSQGNAFAADALDRTISLDIAPNTPLDDALIQWGERAGVQVMMDTSAIGRVKTPGVHGTYRATDALSALLSESGLVYKVNDAATVTVTPAAEKTTADHRASQELLLARLDPPDESPAQPTNAKSANSDSTQFEQEELKEVVVTGTHIRGALTPTNLITIDQADIQDSGYTSTAALLATLPENFSGAISADNHYAGGHNVVTNTGYSTGVDLRGLGDSTLILLDGHRLPLTGVTGSSDLSMIPLGIIERIDVLTDGASAIYGSDAVGGVVNVISKKQQDGFQTTGTVGTTTQGGGEQTQGEAMFGKSWAGGDVLFAYDYAHQDPVLSSQRAFSQLAQSPTDLIPRSESNSVAGFLNQSLSDSLALYAEALWNSRTTVNQYNFYGLSTDDVSVDQFSVAAGLRFQLPKQWNGSVDAGAGGERETVNYFIGAEPGSPATLQNANNENRVQSLEAQTNGPLLILPSGEVSAAVGGGYRHEQYGDDFLTFSTVGRGIWYAFSEAQVPLVTPDRSRVGLNSLDLNLAVRYDHYSDVGGTTNPKLTLSYAPGGGMTLRGTWGTAFKAPVLSELYGAKYDILYLFNDPTSRTGKSVVLNVSGGNPNLSPEKATVWTTGLDWIPVDCPDLKLSATYFDYEFKDRISNPIADAAGELTDPANAFVLTKNPSLALIEQNVAQAYQYINEAGPGLTPADADYLAEVGFRNISLWSSRGVDLLGRYAFHTSIGQFTWTGNATHLVQTQQPEPTLPATTVSGEVFGPPTWKARSGVSWSLAQWSVSVFGNYTSGEVDPAQVPPAAVSSFTTLDTSASYKNDGVLGGLRVALSVLNAFDKAPPRLAPSSTTIYGFGYDNANYSPLGRQINLSVAVKW